MLRIICAINEKVLDEVRVINTGHIENGDHLYRIRKPEEFNHLEIYHNREKPWHVLAEKALHSLNIAGYNEITYRIAREIMESGILEKREKDS